MLDTVSISVNIYFDGFQYSLAVVLGATLLGAVLLWYAAGVSFGAAACFTLGLNVVFLIAMALIWRASRWSRSGVAGPRPTTCSGVFHGLSRSACLLLRQIWI